MDTFFLFFLLFLKKKKKISSLFSRFHPLGEFVVQIKRNHKIKVLRRKIRMLHGVIFSIIYSIKIKTVLTVRTNFNISKMTYLKYFEQRKK